MDAWRLPKDTAHEITPPFRSIILATSSAQMTLRDSHSRIASVQHGDYLAARRRLVGGGVETYGGQRYSIDALERLIAHVPHLVVSLDGPARTEIEGLGEYVCIPAARRGAWLPGRIDAHWRAQKIIGRLARFAPTHLLLRTNDIIGCQVLGWANARNIPTAVV